MAIKDRSGRNWVPGLFAAFWILLAVFSAAYLFRIVTEPQAQRAESAAASPAATAATSAEPAAPSAPSALSEQQAEALIQANEAKDKEIGELRAAVQDLSGQVDRAQLAAQAAREGAGSGGGAAKLHVGHHLAALA